MARLSPDRLALLRATLAERGLPAPGTVAIPRRAERTRAPLSWAQERLFFLELYRPGTALHDDAVAVRIAGELDVEALRRALAEVQRRHEILRTSFVLAQDGAEQRVHEPGDPGEPPLRVVDASDEARALELAAEDARAPFDLEKAPLWRCTLARIAPDDWLLVLTMHHIVSDGASLGVLFDELSTLYAALVEGREPALPSLPVQFGDYAAWERARDERRDPEHLAFWTRRLGGELPRHVWPGARGEASQLGSQVPFQLAPEVVAGIASLARAERATSNHVLLAAWLSFLAATGGESDVRTGIASSLRTRRELAPLIGFFVQTLVLRADLSGDPTFVAVLRRVRAAALEALEHADLPFDRVVRALERGVPAPLLQTFFSHMVDAIRPPSFAGGRTSWEFVDPGVARFELSLVLHESSGPVPEIRGFLEHDFGVLAPEAARALAGDFLRLLAGAVARPELRASELAASCTPGAPARRAPLPFPAPRRRAAGA